MPTMPLPVAAQPKPNLTCPLCGGPNSCTAAASGSFATPCWCTDVTVDPAALAALSDRQRNESCLCPRCAATPGALHALARPGAAS